MPSKYFTILTNTGSALHANAQIQQTKVPWTHMALGDGGGVDVQPDQKQTGLVREVHRLPITAIDPHPTNPSWIVVEAVVPSNVGGWTVRETAIFGGANGTQCIAVGNYPASYKPVLAEGAVREMVMRMIVEISSTATVNLVIDPAVAIASRDYVDNTLKAELQKRGHKPAVRAATVSAVALNGLRSVDGVSLVAGERVLVKDQVDAKENGIYAVAEGAWTRAPDSDTGAKLKAGSVVVVTEGGVNADTMWTLRTDGAIAIGTTALAWQWMAGANAPDQAAGDSSRKVANTNFVANALSAMAAGYMFETGKWMGARGSLPQGFFAVDGIQVSELLVPNIRESLVATGQDVVAEVEWQADPLKRGKWSSGGVGWVRMPDWNGVQAGSIGGLYFGGDLGGTRRGTVVGDAIQNIKGLTGMHPTLSETPPLDGAFDWTSNPRGMYRYAPEETITAPYNNLSFDASKVVPTASENRPKSVYGTWIMRLYGGYTQLGSLNAAALVAEINALKTRASQLEANSIGVVKNDVLASRGFAVVYTNTGDRTRRCSLSMTAAAGGFAIATMDGDEIDTVNKQAAGVCGMTFDVPPQKTYRVDASGMTLRKWKEQ